MPELACPECRAELKPDLVDDAGRVECPFCRHSWSLLELPQATCPSPGFEPVTRVSRSVPGVTAKFELPALPAGSQIKVVEATNDRFVLYVPGGGKSATGLGCFAVAWNSAVCLFTAIVLAGTLWGNGNDAPSGLGALAILGLFWVVGLGIAAFWAKLKYERTFLLLDRDRLVIQRVLFNRKRIEETHLTSDSRAALVESYQQNDNPVYRIEVQGSLRPAKFGTALADSEKDWLVDRINDFLGREGVWALETPATVQERAAAITNLPASCKNCGAPLSGELVKGAVTCSHCGAVFRSVVTRPEGSLSVAVVEKLVPSDLPSDGPIQIDEDSPDVLQFHYAAGSSSPWRWLVPLFTVPFSLAWFCGVFSFIAGAWQIPLLVVRILFILFSIPFLIVGCVPLAIGVLAVRGRTTVRLTAETLQCRWHAGWLGHTRSLAIDAIDRIGLETFATSRQNPRVRNARHVSGPAAGKVCVARAAGKALYLSLFQDETVSQQVAALLRTRLEDRGHVLADA
jgi:uncharacterized Zn finger protein (UPF0148 family)